jgi:hypothetical protein
VKAAFLLISLPCEMDNIVDNLQTIADLSYPDIHARLMDLAANKSTSSTTDDQAYKAGSSSASTGEKSCTFCKKKIGSMRGIPTKSVGNLRQEINKINRKKRRIKIQTTLSVQLLTILLKLQL